MTLFLMLLHQMMVLCHAGNIPAELSQLSRLKWLLLNNNNLSGDDFLNMIYCTE
jgi:hypothetical protein